MNPEIPNPGAPRYTGRDVHGNECVFEDIGNVAEGFDGEDPGADPAISNATSTSDSDEGLSIPGFISDEEFRKFKLNLNKQIRIWETMNPKTDRPAYVVTNQHGIKQVLAYAALRRLLPAHELQGAKFAARAAQHIESAKGSFLRDFAGRYHIILDGKRIPIDAEAEDMQAFFKDVCKITTLSPEARVAIQHIKILAHAQAADMEFRRFSAMYDGKLPRVYLPITEPGKILLIDPHGAVPVPNGNNQDQLWLEHPEHTPFTYHTPPDDNEDYAVEIHSALDAFEELFVRSQACVVPAMAWFVAMNEGLFPLVRDACSTRFITLHKGNFNCGKTSAAENFSLLHGLGEVLGDVSVAALNNSPERGLTILDNKESDAFTPELINYLLFLATGGQVWRSSSDGESIRSNTQRPVCVITSIEGAARAELLSRLVEVEYFLPDGADRMERGPFKEAIRTHRDRIMFGLAEVIERYLHVRAEPAVRRWVLGVNPIPRFGEHFRELCYLVVAFGRARAGADDTWAKGIITTWDTAIRTVVSGDVGDTSSEYEAPIREVIRTIAGVRSVQYRHAGADGMLYITEADDLLAALAKLNRIDGLPKTSQQFGARLNTEASKFRRLAILRDATGQLVPELKRQGAARPLGVWLPATGVAEPAG